MNILFVNNYANIGMNFKGGAAVYFSNIKSLFQSGHDIHLVLLRFDHSLKADYTSIESFVNKITILDISFSLKRKGLLNKIIAHTFFPIKALYSFVNELNIIKIDKLIREENYDLIWSEWRYAAFLLGEVKTNIPKVYSHHDFQFNLDKLKGQSSLFRRYQKKRAEYKVLEKFDCIVSGSMTELKSISRKITCKTIYLPVTYPKKRINIHDNDFSHETKLIHFGALSTTANLIGLKLFVLNYWNGLRLKFPKLELHVIGSLSGVSKKDLEIFKTPGIYLAGHVEDLELYLTPNNINIIPYPYDTGTRTKFPLLLSYGQPVIAHENSIKCFGDEIVRDFTYKSRHSLQSKLSDLIENKELRKASSINSLELFKKEFNYDKRVLRLEPIKHL